MNSQLTSFTSFEHYEDELGGSITPMIAEKFEALDEDSADLLQVSLTRIYMSILYIIYTGYCIVYVYVVVLFLLAEYMNSLTSA